ncbi:MAG: leucyl aminopeptidase [Chloroflexaceae bacterium]|nr:leucyl aminopeptidase [Chloroflexaceae bacterium]
MKSTIQQGPILNETASLVAIGICENESPGAPIEALLEAGDFCGKAREMALLYPRGALPARRVLLVGMGKRSDLTLDTVRQAAARAAQEAQRLKVADIALALPVPETVSTASGAQAMVEGAELGTYRYLEYQSSPKPEETHQIETLRIVMEANQDLEAARRGAAAGEAIARGVVLARDLCNTPGNHLTPTRLGEIAQDIGARCGFSVAVFGREELEQQGFGGLLAVSRGSAEPPRFIILDYPGDSCQKDKPDRDQETLPTICLVGKGITFDTGGISIKPAANMDDMKMDMGGAAAVLGTLQVVSELRLPLRVVGLISAAENMPGASAYKPGDIITTLSGKTIEVLNTDAEGRIVLADALFYAHRYHPRALIDVATLTGAITIALGPHAIGMMGNHQPLADRFIQAGEATGERVWPLPLWEEYREMMKSEIADLKNIGGREAGSITAAAFLLAFVGDYPWVHLDIAGTVWMEKPSRMYYGKTKGVTGVGVRLLAQVLRDWTDF